jgi:hypothetical protein
MCLCVEIGWVGFPTQLSRMDGGYRRGWWSQCRLVYAIWKADRVASFMYDGVWSCASDATV